jgi:polyprenyl-phospho-N-acetylgalactosaminyl synthase
MSTTTDGVWIVIAAYDEGSVIGDIVARLRQQFRHVIVVDDCSDDGTSAAAGTAGATVLRHPINLGQGAALQTGIRYALGQGAAFIVTFDADGQHRVEDIGVLIETQARAGTDVVLGSRFLGSTQNIPPLRRLMLKLVILFARATGGPRLTDAHNGLRLFTRRAAAALRITQNRMAHASQITEQIQRLGLTVTEAPVTILYTDYSLNKGQKLSNAFTILSELLVARLNK